MIMDYLPYKNIEEIRKKVIAKKWIKEIWKRNLRELKWFPIN